MARYFALSHPMGFQWIHRSREWKSRFPATLEITLPSHLVYADRVARKILDFWHRFYRFHDLDIALRLAVVEAVTNAIEHGNQQDLRKFVFVKARIDAKKIRITVRDEGTGFRSQDRSDLNLINRQLRVRGRGLHIIQHLMDRMWFSHGGRQINLIKFIPR